MKDINDLDVEKYKYYFYTDLTGDFDIKVPTLGGWVSVMNGYDIFSVENGSIIAFDYISLFGFHDAKIVQEDKERHIEITAYEDLITCFEEKKDSNFTFYVFTKSIEMPSTSVFNSNSTFLGKEINQSTFTRCDIGKYGAVPFEVGVNGYNIKKVFNVINYSGIGHIIKVETLDSANKNTNHHSSYMAAETLDGIIKVIYEWSIVAQQPFNNQENVATTALNFINNTDLPNNLINLIINRQPDMGVATYLKTGKHFGQSQNENMAPCVELKNFMISKCRYKSLTTLVNRHPLKPEVPEGLLIKEKQDAEKTIIQYCINNNLDIENISLDEIKTHISTPSLSKPIEYVIDPINAIERLLF